MSTSKTLGNAEPTGEERERMLVALNGLRERFNARGSTFGPASFNEADGTVELRWAGDSRAWVTAWIYGLGPSPSRALLVWRHPSYREPCDDAYLNEHQREQIGVKK